MWRTPPRSLCGVSLNFTDGLVVSLLAVGVHVTVLGLDNQKPCIDKARQRFGLAAAVGLLPSGSARTYHIDARDADAGKFAQVCRHTITSPRTMNEFECKKADLCGN